MDIEKLRKNIRPIVPSFAVTPLAYLYRKYKRTKVWYAGLNDREAIEASGFKHIPSSSLRYRVHGGVEVDNFLLSGKACLDAIEKAVDKVGRNIQSFEHILDFGCGCGRTLIWVEKKYSKVKLSGTDVDLEAINWCKKHLTFADYNHNEALPPIKYKDGQFDLIYAISVFTHLNEDFQNQWLEELKRISKPGGIVLITLHGEHVWKKLPNSYSDQIEKNGFLYLKTNDMKGLLPDWYQAAYHKRSYVDEHFSKYFKILDYQARGINNHQDYILLERK